MAEPFQSPPLASQFLASPFIFLLRPIYRLLLALRAPPYTHLPSQPTIRIVCISDTHDLNLTSVPDGDLLIHCGDMTNDGSRKDIQTTIDWLKTLPHRKKVVIAGNHDGWLDPETRILLRKKGEKEEEQQDGEQDLDWGDIHYLQNNTITLSFLLPSPSRSSSITTERTLTIHGVPQIPQLLPFIPPTMHAFQYPRSRTSPPWPHPIPLETDILISHSPPLHHLDLFPHSVGCSHLLDAVWRVRPALHVFGHAHAGRGVERVYYDGAQRAWERLCTRRQETCVQWKRGKKGWFRWLLDGGVWRDPVSWQVWKDVASVIWYAGQGALWTRVWGGEGRLGAEGWMVNAACMDGHGSGQLTGAATVIDL